jgi:Glycine zipper 2TM domain
MRFKALILVSAIAATAMPAFAQDYGRNCHQAQSGNQIGGAVIGSIIGGVLGSNVAANGHRDGGTAVGAVLGGLVGSGIGKDSVNCGPNVRYAPGSTVNPNPNYGGPSYNQYGYGQPGYAYGPGPANSYPTSPGYSPPRYGDDDWYRDDSRSSRQMSDDLYGRDDRAYKRSDDYAGEDCSEAVQITKMPDGSEIRRPIAVCRDAYYGDWQVRD